MSIYLFTIFISFVVNAGLIIPFINWLYRIKFQRKQQETRDAFDRPTPIFDKFHHHKQGTPVGGGILLILTTVIFYFVFLGLFALFDRKIIGNYPSVMSEIKIILFSFIAFGFLGLYDDLKKIFFWGKEGFIGLRLRHKLIIEIVLAVILSFWMFNELKINIIHIPFFGVYHLNYFFIIFAAFVIVSFANAVNITDGLDGLASGILMISLFGFWVISRSILDIPTSLFIGIWLGGLIAFIYFNIYPSRLFLGDTGALSFGATFAVIGLILGKAFALLIIGGIFVAEILTSLIQLLGKRFLHRKVFPVAPLHLWLQEKGWEEPKIVMRMWLMAILFVIFGLMIAFMK